MIENLEHVRPHDCCDWGMVPGKGADVGSCIHVETRGRDVAVFSSAKQTANAKYVKLGRCVVLGLGSPRAICGTGAKVLGEWRTITTVCCRYPIYPAAPETPKQHKTSFSGSVI